MRPAHLLLTAALLASAPALASRPPNKLPFRALHPKKFAGGEVVASSLRNRRFDFLDPNFKLGAEEVVFLNQEARSILGQPGGSTVPRFRIPYKAELDRLGVAVTPELLFEESVYTGEYQGLKWESYKVSTQGSHFLNKAARRLLIKEWPVDLYLDPALHAMHNSDGATVRWTRTGRIGIVLHSDLIYNQQPQEWGAGRNRATLVETSAWVSVMHELARRGLVDYHPNAPVNIHVESKARPLPLMGSHTRSFMFDNLVGVAAQLSAAAEHEGARMQLRSAIVTMSDGVLALERQIESLWSQREIVSKEGARFLRVGSPEELAFYFHLPAKVSARNALAYAKGEIKRAALLARFNREKLGRIPMVDYRRAQLEFIDNGLPKNDALAARR